MKQPPITRYTLDDCPDWVREHPDWSPWETGRGKVLEAVRVWYDRHAPRLRDEVPSPQLAEDAPLVGRMLTCLLFHWEQAGTGRPHKEIVEALEQGKGTDGGDLKGKPFFDLVLTQALCDYQKKASNYYGGSVEPQIFSTARYGFKLFSVPYSDEWRGDFYCYLIETNIRQQDKPLERYLGMAGLVPWLRKMLVGFLRDRFRKEGRYQARVGSESSLISDPDAPSLLEGFCNDTGTPLDAAMLRELADLLRECLKEAFEKLTPKERLRLCFFYGEKRQNQWIARIFNEKDYQTTRERDKAIKHFQEEFFRCFKEKISSRTAISDCLPQLSHEAAEILAEIFQANTKGMQS